MIQSLNPPLRLPKPTSGGSMEYAYYRETADERRPARALGKWAEVWERIDGNPRNNDPANLRVVEVACNRQRQRPPGDEEPIGIAIAIPEGAKPGEIVTSRDGWTAVLTEEDVAAGSISSLRFSNPEERPKSAL